MSLPSLKVSMMPHLHSACRGEGGGGEWEGKEGDLDQVAIGEEAPRVEVGSDGSGEEERVLGDDSAIAPQNFLGNFLDVDSSHGHLPAVVLVEVEDRAQEGALPAPRPPHHSNPRPGGDDHRDVSQSEGKRDLLQVRIGGPEETLSPPWRGG
jgi:hypothetical protein